MILSFKVRILEAELAVPCSFIIMFWETKTSLLMHLWMMLHRFPSYWSANRLIVYFTKIVLICTLSFTQGEYDVNRYQSTLTWSSMKRLWYGTQARLEGTRGQLKNWELFFSSKTMLWTHTSFLIFVMYQGVVVVRRQNGRVLVRLMTVETSSGKTLLVFGGRWGLLSKTFFPSWVCWDCLTNWSTASDHGSRRDAKFG